MVKGFLFRSYRFFYRMDLWRARRVTPGGGGALFMVIIVALMGMDTRQSLLYHVYALLFAIVLPAFLWSQFSSRIKLKARRVLPKYATAGEPFVYTVRFENLSPKKQKGLYFYENFSDPRPTMAELLGSREPEEDQRNLWDRKILYYRWLWLISKKQVIDDVIHAIPDLTPRASARVRVKTVPRSRGYLYLDGFEIAKPDPLGLFRTLFSIDAPQKMVVLPKRYMLPDFPLPGATRYHAGGVSRASSVGNYEEFVSLRDYRPGDSMRRIHWKSSARKRELIIKEFQDEYFVRHALILDTFTDVAYSEVLEEAISLAASFVCTWQTRESLLDLIFVGDRAYHFSSGRGTASSDTLLELLAGVNACTDKSFDTIEPPVLKNVSLFSGCICVFLGWDDVRKAFVRKLKQRGIQLLVFVVVAAGQAVQVDPGPMQGQAGDFIVLQAGRIQEGLSQL